MFGINEPINFLSVKAEKIAAEMKEFVKDYNFNIDEIFR